MNGSSLNKTKSDVKNYKTIFISDIHLGSKACQAELLLDFLKHNDSEKLYLVGDIVYAVDMAEGFDNIPATIQRLYTGQNLGKQLLKIADPE
ncbi:hypothetical protein N9Z39_02320 [Alphaproteobacteria bacterium]|nr:hypothetical protein [Alphaproteobacteria bacterium]